MAKLGHHDREPEWTDERERAWFFAHGLPPAPAPAPFDQKRFFRRRLGRRPGDVPVNAQTWRGAWSRSPPLP